MARRANSTPDQVVDAMRSWTEEEWHAFGCQAWEDDVVRTRLAICTRERDRFGVLLQAIVVVEEKVERLQRENDELRAERDSRKQRPRRSRGRGRPAECEARDVACLYLQDDLGMTANEAVGWLLDNAPGLLHVKANTQLSDDLRASLVNAVKQGRHRIKEKIKELHKSLIAAVNSVALRGADPAG
jgi:hypothetical protein